MHNVVVRQISLNTGPTGPDACRFHLACHFEWFFRPSQASSANC